MNTGLINGFKSKEKALAWAVIEQAIIDYRATNCQQEKDEILDNHVIVKSKKDLIDASIKKDFISLKEYDFGFEGLISNRKKAYELFGNEAIYEKCTLEDILLYYTRRD